MDLEVDTIVDTNPTSLRSAARSTDCASLERSREDRICSASAQEAFDRLRRISNPKTSNSP
jgi:hypothetical protein